MRAKLPVSRMVACRKVAHLHHYGLADVERQKPITEATIFRF
ncbi:MAG: hypothetical protein R2867_30855 [Caldilineaceae bacterium]